MPKKSQDVPLNVRLANVTNQFKTPGIVRAAFEYQDLIGIEILIHFFRDSSLYTCVELECLDPRVGHLDDIVATRSDGSLELIQVKFTVDPNRHPLSWDWLMEAQPKGTSLLQKWLRSLNSVMALGQLRSARLRTNRRPDMEFQRSLRDKLVHLSLLSPQRRRAVEAQLGGARAANSFFDSFEFAHSEQMDDDLEIRLRGEIVPSDTDTEGWLLLRQEARRWATRKLTPEPDGKIRHHHLVQVITKKRSKPIPQNFEIPFAYSLPDPQFHDEFMRRVTTASSRISILWGTPGKGKSTYLSFLVRALAEQEIPVVRHHYFLSFDDTTTDRVSFPDIANSLLQQMASQCPDAIRGVEERPDQLREWITACGKHFASNGKPFLVLVDGLDHVWRDRMNLDQMNHLFSYLLPCPENVALVIGTQRIPDAQLPFCLAGC